MTNRMELDDVERLSRLRAGDLSGDEARALRLEVERRPELARALARLERLDQLVSEHELVAPVDVARSAASMPRAPRRQAWIVGALTAAATLVLVASLARREPEPVPAPSVPATAVTLTAGVSTLKSEVAGAQVQLAPFSHVIVEDGSLRLTSGSVLVQGTARVVTAFGSLIGEGTFVASTEPSRAVTDVTALHPQSPGDVMLEPWQQQAKSWAQTGLVVLVLTGSAQVSAGDVREVLTPGQAFGPKKEVVTPPVEPPKPAAEVQVVKAVATLTPKTPRPAEMVDLADINKGVMTHEAALMKCLGSRPMPDRGQVVALLTLQVEDGRPRVSEATVSDEAPVDPLVASCVLEVLQRVDYPRPDGADLVQLKYPIEYSKRGVGSYLVTLPAPPGGAKLGLAPPRADLVDVQVGNSPTLGPADAKVTVVLFTELECSFCERAHETFDRLRFFASNRSVRFVYKHLPLDSHPFAREAALRLIAADEQGRFWEYLERARQQKARTTQALDNVALGLSLDLPRFRDSVASPPTAKRLQEDLDEAKRIGTKAVPTWYVNGQEFVGARPTGELMKAVLEALKR